MVLTWDAVSGRFTAMWINVVCVEGLTIQMASISSYAVCPPYVEKRAQECRHSVASVAEHILQRKPKRIDNPNSS